MNTKEVQALENYFKTENEHWNGYAFEMICEVLQKGNFENPETLKAIMQKELEQLPETLKDLEPVQRLNVLCKLIPYVLPKVEAVHSQKGEPETENKTTFSGYQW